MSKQVPVEATARADTGEEQGVHEVAQDVAYQRLAIVNVVYWGRPHGAPGEWVLIDAGVAGTAPLIMSAVERRFGSEARPAAVVLTHGHFDHVGALATLAEHWNVPVYAHAIEHPYLSGQASYPPPDPSAGGGLMSTLSRFYPQGPVDVSRWLKPLPADGHVPGMPGWEWIHTPGHTPGHVSLWRKSDKLLIAGDAVITTAQESAYAVAVQRPELHGPPMYFTHDWEEAEESARRLAALEPELAVTGHGPALHGPEMRSALHRLASDFRNLAVPKDQG